MCYDFISFFRDLMMFTTSPKEDYMSQFYFTFQTSNVVHNFTKTGLYIMILFYFSEI